MPDFELIMKYVERLGLPVVLILLASWAAWVILKWLGKLITRGMESYVARNERTAAAFEKLAEKTAAIQGTCADSVATLVKHHAKDSETTSRLVSMVGALQQQIPTPICLYPAAPYPPKRARPPNPPPTS